MALPINVGTGKVTGRFIVGIADGADVDDEPDAIPAKGAITFTASVPYLPDPTAAPSPVTILHTPIVGVLDADGVLCTPDPADPMQAGTPGLRLIATDDPDLSVQDWTWSVTYGLASVGGAALKIPTHSMALPAGGSIDLTTVVKVPSSTGIGTEQAEALAAAAQAAAQAASDAAVAAAQAAADAASAAAPTDAGVSTLVTTATATRAALDKAYRTSISVTEYGATGDGVTNDSTAIQATINAVAAQGGGECFFPPGVYSIGTAIAPAAGVALRGANSASSRLIVPVGSSTGNPLLYRTTGEDAWIEDLSISHLGFEGRWEEFPSQVSNNGLATLKYIRRLTIDQCHFKNSRSFTLNINACDQVTVTHSTFENGTRDLCGIWGSPRVIVFGNRFAHNDDDAISISWEGSIAAPPTRSWIQIIGNSFEDCGPVRTQVPSGAIISDNTMHRTRGMGIFLSILNASKVNTGTGHSNIIKGNVIRDVIDRNWNLPGGSSDGTVNLRSYILIESNVPQTGGLPSVPGQPAADGTFTDPYGSNYAVSTMAGNVGPIRMPHGVIVDGNICKRTLPAVAKYSDWGYGPGYSMDGWVDRPVQDRDLRGVGVRVTLPVQSLMITNNLLEAGARGVSFGTYTGVALADRLAQGVTVQGNKIRDCVDGGIYYTQSTLTHQDIQIVDNEVDCDPYFIAAGRRTGGTWASSGVAPIAINVSNAAGVLVARNRVRNAGAAIVQGGAGGFQDVHDNLVYGDFSATGFSSSNRGVGTIPGIGHGKGWWVSPLGSNPTTTDYGLSLGALPRDSSSVPTTGKWLAGMFVSGRATAATDGRYSLGWLRTTNGTGNAPGTDWAEIYAFS